VRHQRQDAAHRLAIGRHAVVGDWLAQVLNALTGRSLEWKQLVVHRQLAGFGQVDEAGHAAIEKASQPLHRLGT
jgi:hypothetical protein